MKKEIIKDLEEMMKLGVNAKKTISKIKNGDFDDCIAEFNTTPIKVYEASTLLKTLTGE